MSLLGSLLAWFKRLLTARLSARARSFRVTPHSAARQRSWRHFSTDEVSLSDYAPLLPIAGAALLGHAMAWRFDIDHRASAAFCGALLVGWFVASAARRQGMKHADGWTRALLLLLSAAVGLTLQTLHYRGWPAQPIAAWITREPAPIELEVELLRTQRFPTALGESRQTNAASRGEQHDDVRLLDQPMDDEQKDYRSWATVHRVRSLHGREEVTGGVELLWQLSQFPHPGERWRIFGRIKSPPDAGNPRQFNRRVHLAQHGIQGLVEVSYAERLRDSDSPLAFFRRELSGLRQASRERLERQVSGYATGLAIAVILGDRDALDETIRDHFQRTGIGHVLAISGLHVSLLLVSVLMVLRGVGCKARAAGVGAAMIVALYALLAGGAPSVLRAVVLAAISGWSWSEGRRGSGLQGLACAALLLSSLDPGAVSDLGAQLSFLGVAGLVLASRDSSERKAALVMRHWRSRQSRWRRVVARAAATLLHILWTTSWVVMLTGPLVAHHFHLFAWGSWILNLWISLPLAAALLACLITSLPAIGEGLGGLTGWIATRAFEPLIQASAWIDRALPAQIVAGPSTFELAIGYVTFAAILFGRNALRCHQALAWLVAWLILSNLLPVLQEPRGPLAQSTTSSFASRSAQVTLIDVGHGNATLVAWPDGSRWLIDAGSAFGDRMGVEAISSVLWHQRIRRLDLICLSHPDRDHFNAMLPLLDRFKIEQVAIPAIFLETEDRQWQLLLSRLRVDGIELRLLKAGDCFDLEQGVWRRDERSASLPTPPRFSTSTQVSVVSDQHPNIKPTRDVARVLYPQAPRSQPRSLRSDNEGSLVLLLEIGGRRILLPGDLEGPDARRVAEACGRVDALMAPHHGSSQSDPELWIDRCRPEWILVSGSKEQAWMPRGSHHDAPLRPLAITREFSAGLPRTELALVAYEAWAENSDDSKGRSQSGPIPVLSTRTLGCIALSWTCEDLSLRARERRGALTIETWRGGYQRRAW